MTLKDLFKSIDGEYSIIITKKDGYFSDDSVHVSYKDPFPVYHENRTKAMEIAERTNLILEKIIHDKHDDLLIALKEV